MKIQYILIIVIGLVMGVYGLFSMQQKNGELVVKEQSIDSLASLTDEQWKERLSPTEFSVLRKSGTEIPFTSPLLKEKRPGTYVTADCGEPVFRSEQKFETGTGWPSFWAPISKSSVVERPDLSAGDERTEIVSPICKSHLGHVFNDAPNTPTGLRYCINGVALKFIPDTL